MFKVADKFNINIDELYSNLEVLLSGKQYTDLTEDNWSNFLD